MSQSSQDKLADCMKFVSCAKELKNMLESDQDAKTIKYWLQKAREFHATPEDGRKFDSDLQKIVGPNAFRIIKLQQQKMLLEMLMEIKMLQEKLGVDFQCDGVRAMISNCTCIETLFHVLEYELEVLRMTAAKKDRARKRCCNRMKEFKTAFAYVILGCAITAACLYAQSN